MSAEFKATRGPNEPESTGADHSGADDIKLEGEALGDENVGLSEERPPATLPDHEDIPQDQLSTYVEERMGMDDGEIASPTSEASHGDTTSEHGQRDEEGTLGEETASVETLDLQRPSVDTERRWTGLEETPGSLASIPKSFDAADPQRPSVDADRRWTGLESFASIPTGNKPPQAERPQMVMVRSHHGSNETPLSRKHAQEQRRKHIRSGQVRIPQTAERMYHPAWPVIRSPFSRKRTACTRKSMSGPSVHSYAGPNKSRWRSRRALHSVARGNMYSHTEERWQWPVNPAASVPMRPVAWKRKTWMPTQPRVLVDDWKVKEDQSKESRDRDMASKLGYETLLGNLVHSGIPGARDLNRSWNHFLHQEPMTWGFPYWRGSLERPQLSPPAPYLVYQLKEKLWKQPRVRLFKTQGNE